MAEYNMERGGDLGSLGLDSLVDACRQVGDDLGLVQGAGGNLSLKIDKTTMLVKGSGLLLRDVTREDGIVAVMYPAVREGLLTYPGDITWSPQLEEEYLALLRAARTQGERMPSLETGFHALLDTAVVHTHPLAVNAYCCTKAGALRLEKLFPGAPVVPYAAVGAVLSRRIADVASGKGTIFLLNHGLIVNASSLEECVARTQHVVTTITEDMVREGIVIPDGFGELATGGRSEAVRELFATGGVSLLTGHAFPDSVVYCKKGYVLFGKEGAIRLSCDGEIDASALASPRAVAHVVHASAYIALAGERLGGVRQLSEADIAILSGMASEKYRQQIAQEERR